MNIQTVNDNPAKSAPVTAMPMLKAIIFREVSLSERTPAGNVKNAWQSGGMAAMIPICLLVSVNSALIKG